MHYVCMFFIDYSVSYKIQIIQQVLQKYIYKENINEKEYILYTQNSLSSG